MTEGDPRDWVNEPLRRAVDGILYRWIGLFGLTVVGAVAHALGAANPRVDTAVHFGLPLVLVAFIAVHLVGRPWRRRGAADGWERAAEADGGTVVFTRAVGLAVVIGCPLALVAPLASVGDGASFITEVLLWFPLLWPLYALAVWVTLDCARHRLGRAVDESHRRMLAYWHGVADHARGGAR